MSHAVHSTFINNLFLELGLEHWPGRLLQLLELHGQTHVALDLQLALELKGIRRCAQIFEGFFVNVICALISGEKQLFL